MALLSLKETIESFGLSAKKSLGQNFILDQGILARIARVSGDLRGVTVLEIGPGPGGLTRAILDAEAPKIICVEKDQRCVNALSILKEHYNERIEIIEADALSVTLQDLCGDENIKIIANLPYNIATVLLINWLKNLERIESMTLMFQKEVALRITASANSEHYGRLSVLAQWMTVTQRIFDLPSGAFSPPPKVSSSIVHFKPREDFKDREKLASAIEKVTSHAFGQRRKMIRSSLKPIFTEDQLVECEIPSNLRAENLSVEDFAKLARMHMNAISVV